MLRTSSALLLALGALAACSSTTATTAYTPVTGVTIQADSLVASVGCGEGLTQVYEYAAVVYDDSKAVRGTGLYPCYSDGLFANLVGTTTSNFTVKIYAFNSARFSAEAGPITAAINATDTSGNLAPDVATLDLQHTYETDCLATQQSGVQVLAVCNPLR